MDPIAPVFDPEQEIAARDRKGRAVPKYYSELEPGVFVENQETGNLFRGPDGKMMPGMRATEKRGILARAFGFDDPAKANERTWIDATAEAGKSVGRAATNLAGQALTGLGAAATGISNAMGETVTVRTEDGEILEERPYRNEERLFGAVGRDLMQAGQGVALGANPNERGKFLTDTLPSGLAQMGMQVGAAAVAGPMAAGTLMTSSAAGAGYQDAVAAGADESTALLSAALNAPIGALEMLPVANVFRRVNKATGGTFGQVVKKVLADGAVGSLEEAVTEGLGATWSNAVAQKLYDEDRNLFQGVQPAMQQGGSVGFITNLLLSGIANARNIRQAPGQPREFVNPEVLPPSENVDAVWLSDETGLVVRNGELVGPFPAPRDPGVQMRGVEGQGEAGALPGRPGANLLPGNLSEVRLSDLVDPDQIVDETLTPEEEARLPLNALKTQQKRDANAWRGELDQPLSDARKKILERVRRTPLRAIDHPVAQLRALVQRAGGLKNEDGSIPPELFSEIGNAYRAGDPNRPSSNRLTVKADEDGQVQDRKGNTAKKGTGITFDQLRERLAEAYETGEIGIDPNIDPGEVAEMLTGPAYDRTTGEPRFIPPEVEMELQQLEQMPAKLPRNLMEKAPIDILLERFDIENADMVPYSVKPADMEPGDIVRVGQELYEVRNEGGVKVLRDGEVIPLDADAPLLIDAVVPKGHKMHKIFKDMYQKVETLAAFPDDYTQARADEEGARPPESQDADFLALPALDPEDIVPENATPEQRADKLALYQQLLDAGRIRRKSPPPAEASLEGSVQQTQTPTAAGENLSRPSEDPAGQASDLRMEPPPLELERQTPEQVEAERRRMEEKRKRERERERLAAAMAAPMRGDNTNVAQGALFNDGAPDLLSGPTAEELLQRKKAKRPDPTANMDEIADRLAAERAAREAEAKGKAKAEDPARAGMFGFDMPFRFKGEKLRSPDAEGPALFSSNDADTEAALRRNESPASNPWWKVDKQKVTEFLRSFKRAFPEVPDAAHAVGYYLEQVAHIPNAVEMISRGHLADIVTGLDPEGYKLFQRILVARDVERSIEQGLYDGRDLPFWKNAEGVKADREAWERVAAANPQVVEALERRQVYLQSLVDELVAHELLQPGTEAQGYFHRIVTEYLENAPGPGQQGMKEKKAGFQRRRSGSGKEFVVDYLTAEHDVITNALSKIEYKKIMNRVQALTDKAPALRRQARQRNLVTVHGGEKNYLRVQNVLNVLREESGMTAKEREALKESIADIDVLRPFRAQKGMAVGLLERAVGENLEALGDDPNEIMGAAIRGEYGEGARGAAAVWFKAIAAEEKYIQETLGAKYLRWKAGDVDKRMIPEGYVAWRPSDTHRYFKALSISESVADAVMAEQVKLMPDDVKEVLASAGPEPAWVIPEYLARAMDRIGKSHIHGPVDAAIQKAVGAWKGYVLQAPHKALKYNFNNLTGDADFALATEPKIFAYAKRAAEMSYRINWKKESMNKELRKLALNGVIGGQMRGELPDIRSDQLFELITGEKPHLVQQYMDFIGGLAKTREDTLRIAAYWYYRDAINAGERPLGVSDHAQVKALYDAKMFDEAAMMLAKQSLIDYDNPTVVGQIVKNRAIPFYRWREGNMIRYFRLIENTFRQEKSAADAAKKVGPVLAARLGRAAAIRAAQIAALTAVVSGWNAAFFPDEADKLRRRGRRGHMIVGKNPETGEVYTMRMEGALASFLASLGLDDAPGQIADVAKGETDIASAMQESAAAVISDWSNGSNPFVKTAIEALSGQSYWPDVTKPRPIRDRVEHALKLVSADKLYARVTGKPNRGNGNMLSGLLFFTSDPAEDNYWAVRSEVNDFKKRQGDDTSPTRFTDRQNALYYYRKAQQFQDKAAEVRWLDRYLELGGTLKSMSESLERQHPLAGMTRAQRSQYLQQIDKKQRDDLNQAIDYYQKRLSPASIDSQVLNETLEQRRKRQADAFR